VTHLQCTPSMARMLADDEKARNAMMGLRRMLVGGEALPGRLAGQLAGIIGGPVLNMYGPTETTIWSSVETTLRRRGGRQHRPADRQHRALRAGRKRSASS
jgi:non-ribosomal peptide synthetase component F